MKIVITLLAVVALSACATTLTEVQDIEFQERYISFAARCEVQGGSIWIIRRVSRTCRFGSRYCPPRVGDSYSCGAPPNMQ